MQNHIRPTLYAIAGATIGFSLCYYASKSIMLSWMRKSHVSDFDKVIGIRVYASSPYYALIVYETNFALWKDDVIYIYESILADNVASLSDEEKAIVVNTKIGWYGVMSVTPLEHVKQFFVSIIDTVDVTEIFLKANEESSILNIVNLLLDRDVIQKSDKKVAFDVTIQ